MIKTEMIDISLIEVNKGQIEGLPANPRFIKNNRYSLLVQNMDNYPELLEYRELLVFALDEKYIVIAGNMRLRGMRELNYKKAPCKVLPADTPPEKLRAYTILDNTPFGKDDWEKLANEWNEQELEDWGLSCKWDADNEPDDEDKDKSDEEITCPKCSHTFKKSEAGKEMVD